MIITFVVGLMLAIMPLPDSLQAFRPDWLALLVLTVLWGSAFMFNELALSAFPPAVLVAGRILAGAFGLELDVVLHAEGQALARDQGEACLAHAEAGVLHQLEHHPAGAPAEQVGDSTRAERNAAADTLLEDSKDPYLTVRESYLQNRRFQVYDGNPPSTDEEEDLFDEFFEEE